MYTLGINLENSHWHGMGRSGDVTIPYRVTSLNQASAEPDRAPGPKGETAAAYAQSIPLAAGGLTRLHRRVASPRHAASSPLAVSAPPQQREPSRSTPSPHPIAEAAARAHVA